MSLKSQSAMEYLMTYGWAILIIAIVMIALFQLGLFGGTQSPRATAGACQVIHNVAGSSIAGQCNNVWPKFVGEFDGVTSQIVASSVNIPQISSSGSGMITLTAWAYSTTIISMRPVVSYSDGTYPMLILSYDDACAGPAVLPIVYLSATSYYDMCLHPFITTGTWVFYAVEFDGNTLTGYEGANGQITSGSRAAAMSGNVIPSSSQVYIGYSGNSGPWSGGISDVQVYNTTLSLSEITALYLEGIGGAPIDPTHTVGWWPLNGNTQDYSGNNNQGSATAVVYNSTWTSGYTQP